jgi:FdrA protein
VGGLATVRALRALAADPDTEVLLLVSKPPGARAARTLYELIPTLGKPVVTCLLGADPRPAGAAGAHPAPTLDAAAALAVSLVRSQRGQTPPVAASATAGSAAAIEQTQRPSYAPSQRYLRGLYAGGTLAAEATLVLGGALDEVHSNAGAGVSLRDSHRSQGHSVVDLGADEFTRRRPHPMIDARVRAERMLAEADDPSAAVLLLDVVLGRGAHPDPAGVLAPVLAHVAQQARAAGRALSMVAWVCGTEEDPQQLSRQEAALRAAGVIVCPSNAEAARTAARLLPSAP